MTGDPLTPEEAAFVAAVAAAPADDVPRLAFADWLDDRGDHRRAEVVRLHIALARLGDAAGPAWDRLTQVVDPAADRAWCGLPPGTDALVSWDRGFAAAVRLDWADWCRHGDAVAARQPLAVVHLRDRPPTVRELAGGRAARWELLDGPGGTPVVSSRFPADEPADEVVRRLLAARWPGVAFGPLTPPGG